MKIYLVGGAVRDFLLAKMAGKLTTITEERTYFAQIEKDWVVVGGTPEEMLAKGFRPVGKSFPVFLHPDTYDEYALARTERKIGKGYTGFDCYAAPDVTLEQDLQRRDLTINAMAMHIDLNNSLHYTLIDPYHGQKDLQAKCFRHVSPAFSEDPVRILRVARFASRLGDFTVAEETNALMQFMVQHGEVDALVPDRVWLEWSRSMKEHYPWRFFKILEDCEAKEKLFPEIIINENKQAAMELARNHPEADKICFAISLSDVSKSAISMLATKYNIPRDFRDLSLMVATSLPIYKEMTMLPPEQMLAFFEKNDAFRRADRFQLLLITCKLLDEPSDDKKYRLIEEILNVLTAVDHRTLLDQGIEGLKFAEALREIRLMKIGALLKRPSP